jgi:hypothetical protein
MTSLQTGRRTVLKFLVALFGVALGGWLTRGATALADVAPSSTSFLGMGTVSELSARTLVATTDLGQTVTATLHGFPRGITPRVGDRVGLALGSSNGKPMAPGTIALCAPVGGPIAAVPLATTYRGIPQVGADGGLTIEGVPLAESASVRQAAHKGQFIAALTLDTTLGDHLVLGAR